MPGRPPGGHAPAQNKNLTKPEIHGVSLGKRPQTTPKAGMPHLSSLYVFRVWHSNIE